MASMGKVGLVAILAIAWSAAALAESTTSKTSNPKSNTAPPTNTRSNTTAPAQRINNIVNYNAVKTNQNPGPVNRITPSGTQAMTPECAIAIRPRVAYQSGTLAIIDKSECAVQYAGSQRKPNG
jgi:hypothetical protein